MTSGTATDQTTLAASSELADFLGGTDLFAGLSSASDTNPADDFLSQVLSASTPSSNRTSLALDKTSVHSENGTKSPLQPSSLNRNISSNNNDVNRIGSPSQSIAGNSGRLSHRMSTQMLGQITSAGINSASPTVLTESFKFGNESISREGPAPPLKRSTTMTVQTNHDKSDDSVETPLTRKVPMDTTFLPARDLLTPTTDYAGAPSTSETPTIISSPFTSSKPGSKRGTMDQSDFDAILRSSETVKMTSTPDRLKIITESQSAKSSKKKFVAKEATASKSTDNGLADFLRKTGPDDPLGKSKATSLSPNSINLPKASSTPNVDMNTVESPKLPARGSLTKRVTVQGTSNDPDKIESVNTNKENIAVTTRSSSMNIDSIPIKTPVVSDTEYHSAKTSFSQPMTPVSSTTKLSPPQDDSDSEDDYFHPKPKSRKKESEMTLAEFLKSTGPPSATPQNRPSSSSSSPVTKRNNPSSPLRLFAKITASLSSSNTDVSGKNANLQVNDRTISSRGRSISDSAPFSNSFLASKESLPSPPTTKNNEQVLFTPPAPPKLPPTIVQQDIPKPVLKFKKIDDIPMGNVDDAIKDIIEKGDRNQVRQALIKMDEKFEEIVQFEDYTPLNVQLNQTTASKAFQQCEECSKPKPEIFVRDGGIQTDLQVEEVESRIVMKECEIQTDAEEVHVVNIGSIDLIVEKNFANESFKPSVLMVDAESQTIYDVLVAEFEELADHDMEEKSSAENIKSDPWNEMRDLLIDLADDAVDCAEGCGEVPSPVSSTESTQTFVSHIVDSMITDVVSQSDKTSHTIQSTSSHIETQTDDISQDPKMTADASTEPNQFVQFENNGSQTFNIGVSDKGTMTLNLGLKHESSIGIQANLSNSGLSMKEEEDAYKRIRELESRLAELELENSKLKQSCKVESERREKEQKRVENLARVSLCKIVELDAKRRGVKEEYISLSKLH